MHSEIVPREYASLWPRVVATRFTDPVQQAIVLAILASYSGREPDRVKLGILKAANCQLDKIQYWCEEANCDWRVLLCKAEYPRTSGTHDLKQRDPEKYERLLIKEQLEYDNWLQLALAT